ncbi:hypothetical protein SADUNF_Sadunf19G0035000 [Salix dunnii]|uniref:Uncharacterized protein n=1 Tax=Salix dunnii TaxID=1413687 RepID=A0A835J0B4_9ROSI|nr:hypothetical protein SADUNF_Sadunf19G0035000 [Salix dunnii]
MDYCLSKPALEEHLESRLLHIMEGAPPSSVEDDVNFTLNPSELDTFPYYDHGSRLAPEEVPVNQSSITCNDQAGQNMLVDNNDSIQQTTQFPTSFPQTMTTKGGLDGTSSSWINQNGPNWPQTTSSDQQWTNQLPTSSQVPGMLPEPPMNQWIQCISNQGQVDQASVIPKIDNMQQANLVPRNFGKSTREVQVVEARVEDERISSHAVAGNDVVSMTGVRAQEHRVSEGALEIRLVTEPVDRALEQSTAVLGNLAGSAGRTRWA